MFAKNNEYNDNQKAYREYYLEQFVKSAIIGTFVILAAYIPFLLFYSQISAFMVQGQIQSDHFTVFIICSVVSVAVSLYFAEWLDDKYFKIMTGVYLAIYTVLLAPVLHSEMPGNFAIFVSYLLYIAVPVCLALFYILSELRSLMNSSEVIRNITPDTDDDRENHTAVILAHDANKPMDGGDKNAVKLLDVLKNGNEKYRIYFCLHEKEMAAALTDSYAKRIWIFGHGTKGGCRLTDKFFSYSEFMTVKINDEWQPRKTEPKEYVYQCHCNHKSESAAALTDYMLESKGVLDPEIYTDNLPDEDKMKNYYDGGLEDIKIEPEKTGIRLSFIALICKILGILSQKDFNYNSPSSINYLIDRYEAHLKRKSKYLKRYKI